MRTSAITVIFLMWMATADVGEAGVTFATHGQNNFSSVGLSPDLNSTETYLVPNIADPISNRVGSNTAVIEVVGTRNGGEWSFEEILRSSVHPSDSPAIGELVVLMNWEAAADGSVPAQEAGDAFAGFVLEQHPGWISRFGNIGTVGHSRGAPFIGAFASTLGESNILVDSIAYLDTSVNSDFRDQTPVHGDNVVFAQSLRQAVGNPLLHGIDISGATNINVTPLLASLPGFPQAPFEQEPHFFVLNVLGDTIDQSRDTSIPYGNPNIDRDAFGGQYLHIGNLSHNRPLDGLHPAVGGSATTSPVTFSDGDEWPALTITQESRASLFQGASGNLVDLVYRDPDSQDLTLRVLSDSDANLFDGFDNELLSATLNGGQSDWVLLENLDLQDLSDGPRWLHFELSDGVLTSHATFPMNGAVVPEPSGVLLLAFAMAILGQFRSRRLTP